MLSDLLLTRLKALLPPRSSVLCALSGGADSAALVLALCTLREKTDISSLACAHFNHGLRSHDADADQDFCARLCDKLGVPLYIGKASDALVPASADAFARQGTCSGGEAEFRRARYDFLIKTAVERNIPYIATAHTADDNAETLLLNLIRGTGLDGLAGIPAARVTHGVNIIRPLLDITRSEVLEYLQKSGQDFCDDATNHTGAYRRNRIRLNVIPELLNENPKLFESLSHTTELLKQDREYLHEQAAAARNAITISPETISAKQLLSLPPALSGRIIKQMCESANGAHLELSAKHINAVLALCAAGPSATADLPRGLTARRVYDGLKIEKSAPGITFTPVKIELGQTVSLDGIGMKASWTKKSKKVNNLVYSFLLNPDIIEGGLTIRPRLSGDSIRLAGRGHSKTLRRMFIDAKIPKHERRGIPVLADNAGVAAAGGFGVDERLSPKEGGVQTVLQIYREV